MTGAWSFTVDCPRCGGNLTHLAGSRARPNANLESRAVATCAHCRDTYILALTLRSETNRRTLDAEHCPPAARGIRHGTYGGYRQHLRRNEAACAACKAANALRRQAQRVTA